MNNKPILKRIIEKTGRKPCECKCQECKNQCQTPCLGTPDDILKLIEAGYKEQLKVTLWGVALVLGVYPDVIFMVQAEKTEKGCVFLKDGLCSIHHTGLKPTEGKLSHHTLSIENFKFSKSLSWNIAKEWLSGHNEATITRIIELMQD